MEAQLTTALCFVLAIVVGSGIMGQRLAAGNDAIALLGNTLATGAGLKRLAFVTAATGLGKLTVEDVAGLVDEHGLQSRTFDSMAAARRWVSEGRINP